MFCRPATLLFLHSCVLVLFAVLAGDETPHPPTRACPQKRRFRSNSICFFPFATLEAGGRGTESAALYMGGCLPYAAIPS